MKHKILIADRDKEFISSVKYVLEKSELSIYHSSREEKIYEYVRNEEIDLIVLGAINKDVNRFGRELRMATELPIVVVSRIEDEIKKIFALENGADDYLIKPINPYELKARICNILRRCSGEKNQGARQIKINNFIVDIMKKRIYTKDGVDMDLTGKEFELFYLLSSKPGKVFTRDELMIKIWEYENFGTSRTVDVHVRKLRSKLEKNLGSELIKTKWGEGYYFQL